MTSLTSTGVRLILASTVLIGSCVGISGAQEVVYYLFGKWLSDLDPGFKYLALVPAVASYSLGALIGGIGTMALIAPLLFRFPRLGESFGRKKELMRFLFILEFTRKYGNNLAKYADREMERIRNLKE